MSESETNRVGDSINSSNYSFDDTTGRGELQTATEVSLEHHKIDTGVLSARPGNLHERRKASTAEEAEPVALQKKQESEPVEDPNPPTNSQRKTSADEIRKRNLTDDFARGA